MVRIVLISIAAVSVVGCSTAPRPHGCSWGIESHGVQTTLPPWVRIPAWGTWPKATMPGAPTMEQPLIVEAYVCTWSPGAVWFFELPSYDSVLYTDGDVERMLTALGMRNGSSRFTPPRDCVERR